MDKVAFLYSGQGDQFHGMGKELEESYPVAAQVFAQCDALRPGTSKQCFSGTEEELRETQNTQPCLFAMELAATAVLLDVGIQPNAVAGFSLGEVAAATASGLFSLETGFRLVCQRGKLMQQAAETADTFMAAVLKLTTAQVQELCGSFPEVYPVNFNCPGQITVSGASSQMTAFAKAVREMGGRILPLKVSGAFHSPFMKEAADAFSEELSKVEFHSLRIPLYSNLTAQAYGEDAAALLSRQICNPVQWEQLIRNMISDGVDTFIEIGPGRTLTNMVRKIEPTVKAKTYAEYLEAKQC